MVTPPFLALEFFVRRLDHFLRIGLFPARGSQLDADGLLDLFAVIGIVAARVIFPAALHLDFCARAKPPVRRWWGWKKKPQRL